MSIPIKNDGLNGAATTQAGRTDQTSYSARVGVKPNSAARGAGEDRVDISTLSETIAAADSAQQAQQASRVQKLAALYTSGRYKVDSQQVSRAMVQHALNAAGETS